MLTAVLHGNWLFASYSFVVLLLRQSPLPHLPVRKDRRVASRSTWTSNCPAPTFCVTFTVPEALRRVLRTHARAGLNALFAASSQTLKAFIADERNVGADMPGFFGVLHTWGRTMHYHPHIHYVVVGGGLSQDRQRWMPSRAKFLAPVHAMSKVFRAKLKSELEAEGLAKDIPAHLWSDPFVVDTQAVGWREYAALSRDLHLPRRHPDHRIVKVKMIGSSCRLSPEPQTRVQDHESAGPGIPAPVSPALCTQGIVKVHYGFYAPGSQVRLWERLESSTCQRRAHAASERERALETRTIRRRSRWPVPDAAAVWSTWIRGSPKGGRLVSIQRLQRRSHKSPKGG